MSQQFQSAQPPTAKKLPKETILHGEKLIDNYAWMREKTNPALVAHLEAENAYTAAVMKGTENLQEELYKEILGRIKQTDLSVPYPFAGYLYYTRTEEGSQYPIYCRKRGERGSEEILLDVNELAKGQKFMSVGSFAPSTDGKYLAYSTDDTGYRQYRLQVKDLTTGVKLPDTAERVGSVLWAVDNQTLFYRTEDETTKRSDTIWRKKLGATPVKVYEEKDPLYNVYPGLTSDRKYVVLNSGSSDNSEVRVIPADRPMAAAKLVEKRKGKIKYDLEHRDGVFYIRTNKDAKDFRIMTVPADGPGIKNWKPYIEAIPQGRIESISLFDNYLVFSKRQNGLQGLEVVDLQTKKRSQVPTKELIYSISPNVNLEFGATKFRYSYSSPITPPSVCEVDMATMKTTLLKEEEVIGGLDASKYKTERSYAQAPDGTRIPVGLTYRRDLRKKGGNPLLLGGYGAYGSSASFGFNNSILSLLDRGFIIATAQIRGGADMGEEWHESGKMERKRTTFTDFIAAADHLVYEGYTTRSQMAITGGSAGGLLIGAVLNMRPDLCDVAVLHVPFVDVINTMLDETLPLTIGEFIEWGNPKNPREYAYMRTYSPYENIRPTSYPKVLVKTGFNDSQVMYWEPAKYVARLREEAQPEMLVFKVNMAAGHGGASGRYDRLREVAFDYAFLLTALKVK